MKWQDVSKLIGGSLIGIVTLFTALFLLTGIHYEHSGDIVCGETCESYINVTTMYWRICFDNYEGTKYENETLFKKVSTSRTLHVNLDNVENIISTEPEIQVDWLVPTYGNNWRPIKSGDCWERGKVNKIKLVGHKEIKQTVKWSFNLEDKMNIDPLWKIIKAEHLDENRSFISDIYSEVRTLDNLWSEIIPDKDYVRVTFEQNLTSDRDITIYARAACNGSILINGADVPCEIYYKKAKLDRLRGET